MPSRDRFTSDRLRELRLENALSQAQLGEKIGFSGMSVSNWERGKTTPDPQTWSRLLRILSSDESPEATPFAAWLKRVRSERKLTPAELAEKAGVTPATIYNLEAGRISNPRQKTRERIERALEEQLPSDTVQQITKTADIGQLGVLEDFDPHDHSSRPEEPGIYVFYDVSDRPIYVGQGGNIAKRIKDHSDKFWFRKPIVEFASYVRISEDSLRRDIEKLLIRFLKSNAVINQQGVDRG